MPWFCHVYHWCTPDHFRDMDYLDYLRLKPLVDATREQMMKGTPSWPNAR